MNIRNTRLSVRMLGAAFGAFSLLAATSGHATPLPLIDPHFKPKWEQAPDMDQGTDYLSMHRTNGPVVADDFRSNGMPIWGFHWWGSYFLDAGQVADQNVDRLISFEISFHPDCPVGSGPGGSGQAGCVYDETFSYPGQPYQSVIVDVEESFFGTTARSEDVYEYWVALDTPWEEIAGNIYWVDFAWNAGQVGTSPSEDVWGWHESNMSFNDNAVQTSPPSPGGNPHQGPWVPLQGVDMAFEVWTVPEPGTMVLLGLGLLGAGYARRRCAH